MEAAGARLEKRSARGTDKRSIKRSYVPNWFIKKEKPEWEPTLPTAPADAVHGKPQADPAAQKNGQHVEQKAKRHRGRPKGMRDDAVIERDRKMKEYWLANKKAPSGRDLAERFRVDSSYAYRLIRFWRGK